MAVVLPSPPFVKSVVTPKAYKKLIDFTALGINTKLFCEPAEEFKKNGRFRSFNDDDYWEEELKRIKEGYTITSDIGVSIKITGEHYSYLNYCNIKLTDDPDKNKIKKVLYKRAKSKTTTFPAFWDGDYIFYWCKFIARWGASDYPQVKIDGGIDLEEYAAIRFPDEIRIRAYNFKDEEDYGDREFTLYGSGKNMVVGKKRRGGYSYKMGNSASYRYHFGPLKATSVLCAYDNKFLLEDALMTKAVECMDFVDRYTPFFKARIKNELDWKKAGEKLNVNGVETEEGRLSQILSASFRGNTSAARGKDADEIYVDECGKAPNLIEFSTATMDSLGDGVWATGQIIWFGTGGGDNTAWEGFAEIFYNPKKWNCLEFENVWDEGAAGTYCGFFVPDYWTNVGFINDNGESLVDEAKAYELNYQMETFILHHDSKGLIDRQMEHPFSPAQAFAISASNIFDVPTIRAHRLNVERNQSHLMEANIGTFERSHDGILKFKIDSEAKLMPYFEYPVKQEHKKDGAVIIWKPPIRKDGKVPENLYIVDADTYRFDESTGPSVGAVYVKIRASNQVPFNQDDQIVAQYVGRPKDRDTFSQIVFYLAEYYNAKIGFENDEPSLIDFAKMKKLNLPKWFESEFELAYDERLKTSNGGVKRKYGMHVGTGKLDERKHTGDGYTKEWMETVRVVGEDGSKMLNLHTVKDIGLLKEWEQYNPYKGNFDRQSAFRVQMYHGRELVYKNIQEKVKERQSKFFNTTFFK